MTAHQSVAAEGGASPVGEPQSPAGSRPERYLARIDAQIALMNTATRKVFLANQIRRWEQLYSAFLATDGESMRVDDPNDPPQASDFTLTISGLQQRYGRA